VPLCKRLFFTGGDAAAAAAADDDDDTPLRWKDLFQGLSIRIDYYARFEIENTESLNVCFVSSKSKQGSETPFFNSIQDM
jgi:hypothetical protein